jgi:hypothetical protein
LRLQIVRAGDFGGCVDIGLTTNENHVATLEPVTVIQLNADGQVIIRMKSLPG